MDTLIPIRRLTPILLRALSDEVDSLNKKLNYTYGGAI